MITLMTAPKLSMVLLYEYYILSVLIKKMNTHTIYTHFLYFQFHQYLPVTFSRQIFWSLIVSTFVLCARTIVFFSMTINMASCKNLFDETYFQFVFVKNKINRFIWYKSKNIFSDGGKVHFEK